MPINSDKPHLWKADVAQSIDFYNDWFLRFAPGTYRKQRIIRTKEVIDTFEKTYNLSQITPNVLKESPGILPILRMVTAPPLARDRLIGLAHLNKAMIGAMEGSEDKPPRLPVRMDKADLDEGLQRINRGSLVTVKSSFTQVDRNNLKPFEIFVPACPG